MAQNEVQKYATGLDFARNVRVVLTQWYNVEFGLEKLSNFLNSAEASDYPDLTAATLSDLASLRTIVNTYLAATDTVALKNDAKTFIQIG